MSTEKGLFRLTSKRFVKMVIGRDFRPVPNVQASSRLEPLSIVVKRPHRRWYRRTKYDYDVRETKLTSLLEDKSDLQVKVSCKDHILNFRNSECDALEAGGGLSIKRFLAGYLNRTTFKCLRFNSGKTMDEGVEKRELLKVLADRKFDINDPEINQIIEANRESVLCVVVRVIRTTDPLKMKQEVLTSNNASMNLDLVDGSGVNVKIKKDHLSWPELSVAPLVLAYEICELKVDMTDGTVQLLLEPELQGGFVNFPQDLDVCEGLANSMAVQNYVHALNEAIDEMTPEERNLLRDIVMMSSDDADIICQILHQPSFADDETRSEKSLNDSMEVMSISSYYTTSIDLPYSTNLSNSAYSTSSADSAYGTCSADEESEPPTPSNETLSFPPTVTTLGQMEGVEVHDDKMSVSSSSTSSAGYFSCPSSPSDGTTTPPIQSDIKSTDWTDAHILSLTTKPEAFLKMLEVIGWQKMGNGTLTRPEDKNRMDLFECFFVLLKRLHHEHPEIVDSISSFSSRTRKQLCGIYKWNLDPSEADSKEKMDQMCSEFDKLRNDIDHEELSRVEKLFERLEENSYTISAAYSMLLALS